MNSSLNSSKKSLLALASAVLLLGTLGVAKAQTIQPVLLDVQISSGTVTITATGNAASTNASGELADGVDLIGFFTSNEANNYYPTTRGLTTTNNAGGDTFSQAYGDTLITLQNTDLNLYNSGSSAPETFSTGTAAFTGAMTFDLSGASLPAANASGAIYAGFNGSSSTTPNVQIGTWQVVTAPEPSSWMLMAGSLVLLGVCRIRRAIRVRA